MNIAYAIAGEGPALVILTGWPFCHLEAEYQIPTYRSWFEGLAARSRLVRYDPRGSGLSDREVDDLSLDARILDLEAVADRLELESFSISAYGTAGPVGLSYAVRHPERVRRMLLFDTYARASDFAQIPQLQGLVSLASSDWNTFTEAVASVFFGWSAGEPARKFAAFLRECVTPEQGRAALARSLGEDVDVTDLLARISVPTLVGRARDAEFPGADIVRSLASAIPDASLHTFDGTWITSDDRVDAFVRTMLDFIAAERSLSAPSIAGGMCTILFTDMEASTALTHRLGDSEAQELVRTHNSIVREALRAHDGSEIKHTGDGIMASFPTASSALACAVAVQQAVAALAEEQPDVPLGLRIGLNAGEPIAEEEDLFGASVQLARRICDHAGPGQIVTSNVVRELATGKGFMFSDIGEVVPKGLEEPVRLWEVRWEDER